MISITVVITAVVQECNVKVENNLMNSVHLNDYKIKYKEIISSSGGSLISD